MSEYIYVDENGNQVNVNPSSPPLNNYPPQSSRGDKADLLDKIKPDLIVEVLRHRLQGEDFIGGKWVKIKGEENKALTPIGAGQIANLMLAVSSQNVSISKLDDDAINLRAKNITETAIHMAIENWAEYGIKGSTQLRFINEIVFSNSLITLKQAEGGGIRRFIQGTTQEVRNVTTEEKKTGWFSGWGRK